GGTAMARGGVRVPDRDARTRILRGGHDASNRIDLQARADGEKQVCFGGTLHRTVDHRGDECLAERDRVALQDPAAMPAWRIGFPRAHAIERRLHRSLPAAGEAHY